MPQAVDSAAGVAGDCWLIDGGDLAPSGLDAIMASGLPIVLAVADSDSRVSGPWIDVADGFVLPGDDDAMVAAVLRAATRPVGGYGVAEMSDGTARTIGALSADASRIAEQLARLAAVEREIGLPTRGVDAALVRRIIKLRRDRDRYFPAEIFADPAWDMLLDLTAARLENKRVPVSSLCIAAAVPTTTALRWVRSLTEAGLFERHVDPNDARRSHVDLSGATVAAMMTYLRAFDAAFAAR